MAKHKKSFNGGKFVNNILINFSSDLLQCYSMISWNGWKDGVLSFWPRMKWILRCWWKDVLVGKNLISFFF